MRTILKYACEYCGREYKIGFNCADHEEICYKNKKNKSCPTCKYWGGETSTEYGSYILCECNNGEDDDYKPDDLTPVKDCEFWEEDGRSKKERIRQWNKRYEIKGEYIL